MSTSAIASLTSSSSTDASTVSTVPTQTLGQNDFLKLLVAQMGAQDPMNPQSNTDFIAQMAQFSSLQQTTSMQTNLSQISSQQQLMQANSLIGRQVSLQATADQTAQGVVSEVQVQSGTPKIIVNGQSFDLSQVLSIQPVTSSLVAYNN